MRLNAFVIARSCDRFSRNNGDCLVGNPLTDIDNVFQGSGRRLTLVHSLTRQTLFENLIPILVANSDLSLLVDFLKTVPRYLATVRCYLGVIWSPMSLFSATFFSVRLYRPPRVVTIRLPADTGSISDSCNHVGAAFRLSRVIL